MRTCEILTFFMGAPSTGFVQNQLHKVNTLSSLFRLSEPVLYDAGGRTSTIVVEDVNEDRVFDVVAMNSGEISIWVGNDDHEAMLVESLVVGDLDGDGYRDLTVATDSAVFVILIKKEVLRTCSSEAEERLEHVGSYGI